MTRPPRPAPSGPGTPAGRRRGLVFPTLRGLPRRRLPGEVLAALMLLAIALPEQLATARLMGMAPITGLVAFAAGTLAFAAFGTTRALSVGADSTIAPIMAATLATLALPGSPHYVALAGMLATLTGAALILSRPLRLGWIADLLSIPVTTGFMAGIAVHILASALPPVLGIDAGGGGLPQRLLALARALPHTDPATALLGFGTAAVCLAARRVSRHFPGALLAMALAAAAVPALGLAVPMLGALPRHLPMPVLLWPSLTEALALVPLAGMTALMIMMQTAAVRQALPEDTNDADPGRDFAAVGAGSILAALMGGFAVNASPPRSAALVAAGAHSQLSGVIAVALTLLLVLLGADGFAFLPQAALSGILIFVALHLLHLRTLRQIAQRSPAELLLTLAAAALVILLPVSQGVWLAILLSLGHALYLIARPASAELHRVPGTTIWWALSPGERGETEPGVLVFALGAPLSFLNARLISDRLRAAVDTAPAGLKLIVIEAQGVIGIDFTGARILAATLAELRAGGHEIALARLENERAQAAARRTGLIESIGETRIFRSVEEAVTALRPAG